MNIFISYRHADSEGYVGRLYDQLLKYYDPSQIFMDASTLQPGENFETKINSVLENCKVLLAVIGPRWLDIPDDHGQQRLDDPDDFVRMEITTALKRRLRCIPVLVERAAMPPESALPAGLAPLAKAHALELSHSRFASDIERLVETMGGSFGIIKVSLGDSYQSLIKTRLLNPNEKIEVQVDRKLVGLIQGPGFNLGQSQPKGKPCGPVVSRLEAGNHTIQVSAKKDDFSPAKKSKRVSFQIKGGQQLNFLVEHKFDPSGKSLISIQPLNPITHY